MKKSDWMILKENMLEAIFLQKQINLRQLCARKQSECVCCITEYAYT